MTGALANYTPDQAQAELDRARTLGPGASDMSDRDPAIEQRAHEVERELKRSVAVIRTGGIYFAHWAHEYIEQRLWEVLEHESLQEGLAQPGIEVSEKHARNLAGIYRFFVVERGVPIKDLHGVDLRKLQIAIPAIRKGDATKEQAIADAHELTRKDMDAVYKRGRNKELDAGEEPEQIRCPCCGKWGEKAKMDPTWTRAE